MHLCVFCRFMRSVNPPLTFGKPVHAAASTDAGLERTSSSDSESHGQKEYKTGHRGHKASYIFAPLAPQKTDQNAA